MSVFVYDTLEDHHAAAPIAASYGLEEVEAAFDEDAYTHRDKALKGSPENLARLAVAQDGDQPTGEPLLRGVAYTDRPEEMRELVRLTAEERCFARVELVGPTLRRGVISRTLRGLWRS